ncbi:hypothetical protein BU15DRAFT_78575 [Melanogaster broomeanus]|nr:hypothetical protein BU15DRAFT_78575 [Melanogaster broomeanus]
MDSSPSQEQLVQFLKTQETINAELRAMITKHDATLKALQASAWSTLIVTFWSEATHKHGATRQASSPGSRLRPARDEDARLMVYSPFKIHLNHDKHHRIKHREASSDAPLIALHALGSHQPPNALSSFLHDPLLPEQRPSERPKLRDAFCVDGTSVSAPFAPSARMRYLPIPADGTISSIAIHACPSSGASASRSAGMSSL